MGEFIASIRRGFAGVLRFSGRDTRQQFWPYAIFIFLLAIVAGYVVIIPEMVGSVQRIVMTIAEQDGREIPPHEMETMVMGMMPNFESILLATLVIDVVAVLLLAAAVIRRLHDTDRTGYWGLLPLPSFALGFAIAPRSVEAMMRPPEPEATTLVMLPMLNGMLSWGLLIVLIVLLARQGSDGPNRYGPEPDVGEG